MKARVKEMEAEAAKLREMQAVVSRSFAMHLRGQPLMHVRLHGTGRTRNGRVVIRSSETRYARSRR